MSTIEREFIYDGKRYTADAILNALPLCLAYGAGFEEWLEKAQWGDSWGLGYFDSPGLEVVCVRPMPPLRESDVQPLEQRASPDAMVALVAQLWRASMHTSNGAYVMACALTSIAHEAAKGPLDLSAISTLLVAQMTEQGIPPQ